MTKLVRVKDIEESELGWYAAKAYGRDNPLILPHSGHELSGFLVEYFKMKVKYNESKEEWKVSCRVASVKEKTLLSAVLRCLVELTFGEYTEQDYPDYLRDKQ
jgi:hypothetical protein